MLIIFKLRTATCANERAIVRYEMQDVNIYYNGKLLLTVRAMCNETPAETLERAKRALLVVPKVENR